MQIPQGRQTSPQEIVQQELEQYQRDAHYFNEHRAELLAQYPERWVAIYNQQVVGVAKDPKRLKSQLERKGIKPSRVYREYLTNREELLILLLEPEPRSRRPALLL
jgi:hypothetical protein